ncbi:MAG: hypothetical protein WCC22_09480 [Terriglobales bacterium]
MNLHRKTAANWLGLVSILLAVVPLVYVFHADSFPNYALTESVVLTGGIGGSLFAALIAGLVGSRWWLMALLGGVMDVVVAYGFSP